MKKHLIIALMLIAALLAGCASPAAQTAQDGAAEAAQEAVPAAEKDAIRVSTVDELIAAVAPGADLVADISLGSSGPEGCGTHVFHVEVVPPSGECRFHMKRNLLAPGGRARLVFRMAENDPAGEWTLRACDPLTGLCAERRLRVAGGASRGDKR